MPVLLHVAPGRDQDAVAPADARLDHQARRPDRAVVDQRADQPVDRVAPVVLGDRQDAARAAGPSRSARLQPRTVTASGFSHSTCRPGLQAGDGDRVVRAGVGRDVGGLQLGDLARHLARCRRRRAGALPSSSSASSARKLAFSWFRSQTATSSMLQRELPYSRAMPRRWRRPMPPQPTAAYLTRSATKPLLAPFTLALRATPQPSRRSRQAGIVPQGACTAPNDACYNGAHE